MDPFLNSVTVFLKSYFSSNKLVPRMVHRRHHHGHVRRHHPCRTSVPLLPVIFPAKTPPVSGEDKPTHLAVKLFYIIFTSLPFLMLIIPSILEGYNDYQLPAISLESFSFSNLSITDDRVAAKWEIGLELLNRVDQAAEYTDIEAVICRTDSKNRSVAEVSKEHDDLILAPGKQTMVHLNEVAEKGVDGEIALTNMIMDLVYVVPERLITMISFDLTVKATAMRGGDMYVYVLSCEDIEVTISDAWGSYKLENRTGRADILPPSCDSLVLFDLSSLK